MLQLRNQFGQIDIAAIDSAAVAELSDTAQAKLATLIDCVQTHEAATDRHLKAKAAVIDAEREQNAAYAANRDASDPFPFVPPDTASYADRASYNIALQAARQQHDTRVREQRADEARRAAIKAYVPAQ
jgi:hypothetical protein